MSFNTTGDRQNLSSSSEHMTELEILQMLAVLLRMSCH